MFSKVLVPQILIIERNDQIFDILMSCVRDSNVQIEHIIEMSEIKDKTLSKYSLIIADLNLNEKSHIALIKEIRDKSIFIPIILLGDDRLENKVLSYKLCVSMYHEKPIKCELLKTQIKSLSLLFHHDMIMDLGVLKIDIASKGIICDSGFVPLTTREFNILTILIRAGGRVLSPKQMSKLLPCGEEEITESAIHTIISRIRTKLRDKINEPLILTRHQAGYGINHLYLKDLRFRDRTLVL